MQQAAPLPRILTLPRALPLLWGAAATAVGVTLIVLPIETAIALLALIAFGVLAAITPLSAAVGLAVFAPLRTLIATEARLALPLDIGQWALIVLLAAWVARRQAARRLPRVIATPLYLPVLLFFSAISLTAFNALSMSLWLSEWLKWVQILLLIAFALDMTRAGGWGWLALTLIAAGVGNAIVGLYEFFGGSGALHLLVEGRYFRAFGTFGQPNPFGGFMGMIAPIALAASVGLLIRAWNVWRGQQRLDLAAGALAIGCAAASAIMAAALIASWSRGAWLAFGGAIVVMVFAFPRRAWQSAAALIAVIVLGGVVWASGRLPASLTARIESATQETFQFSDVRGVDINPVNYALVERFAHWQAALNMATANPWLGVGFGNYEAAYPSYRLINWDLALGHAHNYYLNVLAEVGIIGLLAYLGMWIGVVVLTWRARAHPDPLARLLAIGLLGSWTYLALHSVTDNLYVNNLFLHLGLMLGLLAVIYHQAWICRLRIPHS